MKNTNKKQKHISFIILICLLLSFSINASASSEKLDTVPETVTLTDSHQSSLQSSSDDDSVTVGSRFFDLFFGNKKRQETEDIYLCPGGDAFGVKICGSGVTVVKVVTELSSGALHVDDKILKIDKTNISTIEELKEILNSCGGKELSFEILRDGKKITKNITPKSAGGEYHLGVILSDGASGIGTITYYSPKTFDFGGLGHGICSRDGGEVLNMTRGQVTGVILAGASRGEPSRPGELRGVLTNKILGSVTQNTPCGVFGKLDAEAVNPDTEAIPIASRDDVKCGEATIISTVKSGKKAIYTIEIEDIDYSSRGTKSFRIKVTDDSLIALTGGIVRGMSGSPIIQDGKLVGAVTHVLVGDPTEGYGIFIENMLDASNSQIQQNAA